MKDAEKYLLIILLVCAFFPSCVRYNRMTHLSEDELAWITNRHEGEIMLFESQDGTVDTIKVWDICIRNDTDRINWMYWQLGGTEYIADAEINLVFNRYSGVNGCLFIIKEAEDKPIYFSCGFISRWTKEDVPLMPISMQVAGVSMDDVMFFDENMMCEPYESAPPNYVSSYAWSKKYGLVQYTFQDGTTFSRIDLR